LAIFSRANAAGSCPVWPSKYGRTLGLAPICTTTKIAAVQGTGSAAMKFPLTASWGVSFDHLTGGGIDDLSSFSRLGGGTYSPLSVG
jgi:hypothetical protein